MKSYQLTLIGYDGSTDETDNLIVWVKADSSFPEQVKDNMLIVDILDLEIDFGFRYDYHINDNNDLQALFDNITHRVNNPSKGITGF